jgi:RhoGAP domain
LAKLGENETLKDAANYSGFALAGVIKKFFTKLTTPIVPYKVYNHLLSITSQSVIKPEE